jgi:protein TonB
MLRNNGHRFQPLVVQKFAESQLNANTRKFFAKMVKSEGLVKQKSPHANLKAQYKRVMQIASAITLILAIVVFQIARQISLTAATLSHSNIKIEVADIPVTEQLKRPPPPARPTVPIPTEEESVPEDLTISSTEIDLTQIAPPPPPPADDEADYTFVAYDEPPQIIGGMAELLKHLKYPRLAQAAGVEGIVFLKVLVGVDGRTQKTEIIKAKPENMGFEQSAMAAVQKVKWEPAKQRDRKIRVWVSIPVQFKLVSS